MPRGGFSAARAKVPHFLLEGRPTRSSTNLYYVVEGAEGTD